ncbi:FHA domain-containing protein [Montanilutibacter psychrotolerans]|nr:FHA domain-containing protein [Lysobacter psychrotolerans]
MKLVFPGGEHPQVLLGQGVSRIGSDPDANIVIERPGVMPQHCQLHVSEQGVTLDVRPGSAVTVNGRVVDGLIRLRPGDTVAFDQVQALLASMELVAPVGKIELPSKWMPPANEDPGVTAVRAVLPRYVLRGLGGAVDGRNVPLHGVLNVGRSAECNFKLDDPSVSRTHARLELTELGVQVVDLGSIHGCYLNGRRAARFEAHAGDDIGFGDLRFRLIAPAVPPSASPPRRAPIRAPAPAAGPAAGTLASLAPRERWKAPKQVSPALQLGLIVLAAVAALAVAVALLR